MTGSVCATRRKALTSAIHLEFARARGFRKDGPSLRRVAPGEPFGVVQVISVQDSSGSLGDRCLAYINLAVQITGLGADATAERVKEHECPFRQRVGERWLLDDDGARQAVAAVHAEAGPWLDGFADPVALLRRLEAELSLDAIGEWLGTVEVLCRMWARLGEHDKAAAALRAKLDYLARERPRADPAVVHRFASSIGVERL